MIEIECRFRLNQIDDEYNAIVRTIRMTQSVKLRAKYELDISEIGVERTHINHLLDENGWPRLVADPLLLDKTSQCRALAASMTTNLPYFDKSIVKDNLAYNGQPANQRKIT